MPRLYVVALALAAVQTGQLLTLEIRVFRGSEDVSAHSRVTVYRAGQRTQPVSQAVAGQPAKARVPAGIYDAQAVLERDARVLSIRWAQRLVVMPYPDEDGHHLEVINLTPGYGALQIRTSGTPIDSMAIFVVNERSHPVATTAGGTPYALFVVPAGQYDIQIKRGARATWQQNIEVPLDRTRLLLVP